MVCRVMLSELKRHLVLALAGFLHYSGLIRLWLKIRQRSSKGEDICVLGLHRVLSDAGLQQANSLPGIVLRESTFTAIVEFLHRYFSVVPLECFFDGASSKVSDSKLQCLLTFDDGWRDNYTTALPVLKKYRMPAVIFVVTGFIGTMSTFWVERLGRIWKDEDKHRALIAALTNSADPCSIDASFEEVVEKLKHLPSARRGEILAPILDDAQREIPSAEVDHGEGDRMLTWDEARVLQREGIEIEAHSATHPLLVHEDDETLRRELRQSKQVLEQELSKRVRAFAYPNGTWDQRVRKMVEEAGYECAFVTQRGWHRRGADRFAIRRIMLHEGMVTGPSGRFSPALLALRLSGLV